MCLKSSILAVHNSTLYSIAVAAIIASPRFIFFACRSFMARVTTRLDRSRVCDSSKSEESSNSSLAGIVEKPSASILVMLAWAMSVPEMLPASSVPLAR